MNWLEKICLILIFLQFIAVGLLTVYFIESNKESKLQRSTIKGLQDYNKAQEKEYLKTLDSIKIVFSERLDSVSASHQKSIAANKASQREIKNLKEIIFVVHTDSSRTKELKKLYPTF